MAGAMGLAMSRPAVMIVAGLLVVGTTALVVPVTLLTMDLGQPGMVLLGRTLASPRGTWLGTVVLGTAPERPPGTSVAAIGTVELGTAPGRPP